MTFLKTYLKATANEHRKRRRRKIRRKERKKIKPQKIERFVSNQIEQK